VVLAKEGMSQHKRVVLRLRAAPVTQVTTTLQQFLAAELQQSNIAAAEGGGTPGKGPLTREVAIAADPISNCLLLGGPADALEEVVKLVEQLDQTPAMVTLEVVLGETPADTLSVKPAAETKPPAKSEMRRLMERPERMEVVSRARLVTLDNQSAYVEIGRSEGVIAGTTTTAFGQSNNITYRNVGTKVQCIPRVGDDGRVTMDIDVSYSGLGSPGEGVVIATPKTGEPIRAPNTEQFTAHTTLCVPSGQTVVVSGQGNQPKPGKAFILVVTPHVLRLDGAKMPSNPPDKKPKR
jgi:type II secretory pathway component GspD/PulD (secretin)